MWLPKRNTDTEFVLVTKNDEIYDELMADEDFYRDMRNKNEDANIIIPHLTQSGDNAAQHAEVLVKHSKESEDWLNKKWRPSMGWMYMAVCITDFVLFPILWSILQAVSEGQVTAQWQPLTLQGAGLFHIAMGAILGIAVYGRTKEKLEKATEAVTTVK
jgi:hypothetical protein